MSINLLDSFNYKGKRPDFVRQQFGTIAAMKAFSDNYLPDMYLAFCLEDGKVYIYNRNNAVDETTGRWRELEGGGGGGDLTNYYTKSETNALLADKQDELQYDSVPTYGSTNVMTSGGIYNALTSKQNTLVFDNQPRSGSSNPVASSGLYNEFQTVATRDERQQEELDFIANRTVKNLVVPTTLSKTMCGVTFTVGSDNKVTISGGVADPHTFACITLVGATQDQANTYENQVPIPKGSYKVVCLGGSESTYYVELGFRNSSTGLRQTRTVYDGSADFTITNANGRYDLVLYSKSKTSGYTATVAPMVCLMWFDNTYAPYSPTNKELYDMIAQKQNALTFDSAPTDGSSNPVTSDGIYDALASKQNTLTFDSTPTDGSSNPVTSDGIYDALSTKVTAAQVVGTILGASSATALFKNEDLNGKTSPGIYVGSNTVSSYLLNNPVSSANTPFRMYVIALESSAMKMQILVPDSNGGIYTRVYDGANQSWTGWQQYARISDIEPRVFGLGTSLANYNSLDNLTPGNYYAENGTVAGNVNAPYTRSGFNLWVIATNDTTRKVQLLFPNPYNSEYNTKGFFLMRQEVAGTWEDWRTITDFHGLGNAVVVGAAGINMDTLKTEGVWYSASTTGAEASIGRPDYTSAGARVWRLDVYKLYSTRPYQELTVYRLGTSEGEFDKYFRIYRTDDTWTDWQHVDTTTVSTYYPSQTP